MTTSFRWMDHTCTVEAPEELAVLLGAVFPALVCSVPPGASADVRVERSRATFLVSGGEEHRCATVSEAVSAAELMVTRHLLGADRRHCHLHAAAALAEQGGAVLAVGASGSGKSTLAWVWHRSGRPVFGDDVVALDDRGRLHAFPRPLKVDATWLRGAGEAPEDTVAWDGVSEEVWVDPLRGAGWAEGGAPVCLVAEVHFEEGRALDLEPVGGAERLRVLLNAVHATGASREESLDRLIAVAQWAPTYRVRHGSAVEAAEALLRLAELPTR